MAEKKTSKADGSLYKTSRRWETNRKRKLEKTLKAQPNNEQVKNALQSIVYRRKTPNTRQWSSSWKHLAQLIKSFTGKFDPNIKSSNDKVAAEALRTSRTNYAYKAPDYGHKSFFSLYARVNG